MKKKKKKNNMYPWVDRQRNFIGGECPHRCSYCYVTAFSERFPVMKERYGGEPFLIDKELSKGEGKGRIIFVQSCGDLFAETIPATWIKKVLAHCRQYPNTYLFQSKNPKRFLKFSSLFPDDSILGTTLESDICYPRISRAPTPQERAEALASIRGLKKMVSIEPIMDFHFDEFAKMIRRINPTFVSIGADSKNCDLPEPDAAKIHMLIKALREFTKVMTKDNLRRLLEK